MKNTLESLPTDTSKPTTCLEVNLLLNFSTYIWDHHEYLLLKEKKKKRKKEKKRGTNQNVTFKYVVDFGMFLDLLHLKGYHEKFQNQMNFNY